MTLTPTKPAPGPRLDKKTWIRGLISAVYRENLILLKILSATRRSESITQGTVLLEGDRCNNYISYQVCICFPLQCLFGCPFNGCVYPELLIILLWGQYSQTAINVRSPFFVAGVPNSCYHWNYFVVFFYYKKITYDWLITLELWDIKV